MFAVFVNVDVLFNVYQGNILIHISVHITLNKNNENKSIYLIIDWYNWYLNRILKYYEKFDYCTLDFAFDRNIYLYENLK